MKTILSYTKKFIYYLTPIVSALLLFITLSSFGVNRSILDAGFHKDIFQKNHVYTYAYDALRNSLNGIISNISKHSPTNYAQSKDLFMILDRSVTPEMVKSNLDSLREDTFQYMKGKRMFLPDVHLDNKSLKNSKTAEGSGNIFSIEAFSKIGKINLSAILLYINRSDITDWFLTLKFIYYSMSAVPLLSFLTMLIFMLIGLLCCKSKNNIRKWFNIYIFTCASLCVLWGVFLIIYSIFFLPRSIKFITMSLPMDPSVLISYARDCIRFLYIFALICGVLLFAIGISFRIPRRFKPNIKMPKMFDLKSIKIKNLKMIKQSSCAGILLILIALISAKMVYYKFDFEQNDFSSLLSRLRSYKVIQVISAKNDTIYSLSLKVADSKDGTAIQNAAINISGKSKITQKEFNETVLTDKDGTAKLNLDEGTFRLNFLSSTFPDGYQKPSTLLFDLKTAGTTLITVNLDKLPESAKEKWGIAEIEVLDKDNNPVPNLRFAMPKDTLAPGDPDSIFADTNAEGIAVFKVNQGSYRVTPVETSIPKQYQVPSATDITITADTISRYTIRLVEAKTNR